ncbi:MAG: hypothetical protein AAF583_13580 [Pseudomonadota bacterium]
MSVSRSTVIIILSSVVGLAFLFWLTMRVAAINGVSLGLHGWIAIILGSVFSLLVSAVLFGLTFHSARSGHDERIDPPV